MSTMTTPESRTYLAHLIAELLSLPNLPADLHQAVSSHLNQQFNLVNILKPEYCRRLYPILAELAEMNANSASLAQNVNGDNQQASESYESKESLDPVGRPESY
jgi:hypothetical protein